jgi:mono/diheme cytochrome c family protein
MTRTRIVMAAGVVAAAAGAAALLTRNVEARGPAARVERGRYLVTSLGCADCHAPKRMGPQGPEPDPTLSLSGHRQDARLPAPPALPAGPWMVTTTGELTAWSGPWGVSYAKNLTPDENTGIGSWSEETFVQAIRTGRHMGVARPILPPMPWQVYRNMTDEDLRSIYAYLRSLPPVSNRVPEPMIAEPPAGGAGPAQ